MPRNMYPLLFLVYTFLFLCVASCGDDDPTSPELSFLGSAGMCSDLFETCRPEDPDFAPVFEWFCYLPELEAYEMLYLEADLGYWFIVKKETVESSPSLKAVIKSQGLSEPQPLHQ